MNSIRWTRKALRGPSAARRCSPWRDERGIAGIEIAVLLPLMMMLLLGFTEMYLYLRAVSVVERTAFTLADTIGQKQTIHDNPDPSDSGNLGVYWEAATLAAKPLTIQTNGGIIVTEIEDPTGKAVPTVKWQRQSPWTTTPMTSQLSSGLVPPGYPFGANDRALVVEVAYTFKPFAMTATVWPNAPGIVTIYRRVYVRPRFGNIALMP